MPWTPKLAFLLAEAPPEPDPLRPRLFPAAVAEVTLFTAPLTVPARPTPPLADPLCELTEWLAEPVADPLTRPLTLLVIDAGPPATPFGVPPTLPTLFSVLPSEPVLLSVPPTVPLSAPLTVPVTPPSSCASAGAAVRINAPAAKMNDFLMPVSCRISGGTKPPFRNENDSSRRFHPALILRRQSAERPGTRRRRCRGRRVLGRGELPQRDARAIPQAAAGRRRAERQSWFRAPWHSRDRAAPRPCRHRAPRNRDASACPPPAARVRRRRLR